MCGYVLDCGEISQSQVALVGGKAANLGELSRLEGIRVPAGFCVTTRAFERTIAQSPHVGELVDQLSDLKREDRTALATLSAQIRSTIETAPVPDDVVAAITRAVSLHGAHRAYAVRSSATQEDMPAASFAGQQDTYLNVVGQASVMEHVRRCWASLFTDRAVMYRVHNAMDHREVRMGVVVQQIVFAQASGVPFTADPVTSTRDLLAIEASFGLGEGLQMPRWRSNRARSTCSGRTERRWRATSLGTDPLRPPIWISCVRRRITGRPWRGCGPNGTQELTCLGVRAQRRPLRW